MPKSDKQVNFLLHSFAVINTINMKTVGIVGGLDFLGCDITLKFLSENYFVKVLDLSRTKNTQPLISANIKNGENLKIFSIDLNNPLQVSNFLSGCDFLIHCGRPYKLDVKIEQGSLYIPVITDSGCLIKVLSRTPAVNKIIFLTSVAVFNLNNKQSVPESGQKLNTISISTQHSRQKAVFHSGKVISKRLEDFSGSRLEVVHVSPVVVYNNMMTNTRETTLAGLQFLFRNQIVHDAVFKKLVNRNLMETMINANELPGKIYSCIQDFKENTIAQVPI